MDSAELATGGKIAGGIVASGVATFKFFSRFQTKGGCKKAHAAHDDLDIERGEIVRDKDGNPDRVKLTRRFDCA